MNDSLTTDKALLAEQVVLDYLQAHPEFFQQHPQLLAPRLRRRPHRRPLVRLLPARLRALRFTWMSPVAPASP